MNVAAFFLAVCFSEAPENIALGKSYRLAPAPNYAHCTDPGDARQLTDGVRVEGYFWTQQGTVGWSGACPVRITIDLGAIEPIAGVAYSTAAGVAGVSFPSAIWVLASDDGAAYRLCGDLVAASAATSAPPAQGYALHTFRTTGFATRGRFVALLVAGTPYTFADEIEVYRGPPELRDREPAGRAVGDPDAFFSAMRMTTLLRRRLARDCAAVGAACDATAMPDARRAELARAIEGLRNDIAAVAVDPDRELSTAFPIDAVHRRIFAAQGQVWRRMGHEAPVVWQNDRWDMLSPTEPPRGGGASIDAVMMSGEYRSAAFNISDPGPEGLDTGEAPRMLSLRIEGLPGAPDCPYLTVHEVVFTDTVSGTPVAAALPIAERAGNEWRISVFPGLTRQVWLTFNPRDVPPGRYDGAIVLGDGLPRVPVRLTIHPLTFPAQPALHLGGWDYTDRERCYQVGPENREAFIRHLREHFVDTPWAQSAVLPRGEYDAAGAMVTPPSTEEFERWLARWPGARNYFVFAAVGDSFAGFALDSAPFRAAVGAWITWWVERLGRWGIAPGRLGLLLVDEPHTSAQDRTIIAYAKAIRAAQPDVVIFEDPIWQDPSKADPALFELSSILCPNLPMWHDRGAPFREFYARRREAGRRLWFYSCSGPGKLLDPFSYHRMQHWFCWLHGAEGSGFWAFGDGNGAWPWNEYEATVGAYTPLFMTATTVTAGKHMEAIREGIEDYEYLRMLRDRIEELARAGVAEAALAPARELLAEGPARVTACMTSSAACSWQAPKDRNAADQVRVEILDALGNLAGK
ncbi:MAG TPA: hypothetical protein DCM87_17740 [Planctomycetes bacterium]|nr:hypothetical protein [Planctomycetota bacterium]